MLPSYAVRRDLDLLFSIGRGHKHFSSLREFLHNLNGIRKARVAHCVQLSARVDETFMVPITSITPMPPAIPPGTSATSSGGNSCSTSFSSSLHSFLDGPPGSESGASQHPRSLQNAQTKEQTQACAASASDQAEQPDPLAAVENENNSVANPSSTSSQSKNGGMATAKAKPFIQNRSHLATSGTVLSNASTPGTLVPNWILPTFWTADRADGSPADVKSASNNSAPVDQANSDQAGVSESSIATSDRRDSKAELSGSWVAYASVIDRAGLEGATSSDAMNGSAVDRSADSSDKAKEVAQATTGPGEKDAKDVPLTQTPQSNANVSGNIPAVPGAKDANTSNTSAIPSPTALSNAANDAVNTLNVANAPVPSVPASTFVKPIEKALSHAAADAPTTVTQLKTESANSSQANLQSENGGTQQQSSQLDSGGSAKKQPNAAADPLLPAHAAVTAVQPGEAGAIARSVVTNVGVTSPDSTPQATTMANSTAALSAGSTGLSTGSASSSNATSASAQTSQPTSSAASPTAATSPTATAQVTRGQLIQHANQSEIRVSLDSTTLGPVEVRATMRNDTLSAAIGVTKSDVQTFLAAEWPSLHHTLAEHNLRVESLTLTDRSSDARSGLSQGSQQQNDRNFRPYLASVSTSSSAGENTNSLVAIPAEAPIGSTNGGRLSIHA